ncbi:hypothetical protein ABMA27_012922 [Loxostege sticticalis]|uniref:Uncharacterized protein n=1 Tax=Loxostege sticticalis TaxID=481309 RepID=A0ABR3H093_LOXSC
MSKTKCCVRGCKSSPPHFKFPTSRVLIRKWLAALGPRCGAQGSVCSRHFRAEQWECARGRARLNKGVVPTIFDEDIKQDDDTAKETDAVPNANDKHKEETSSEDSRDSTDKTDPQKDTADPLKERSGTVKERNGSEREKDEQDKDKSDPEKDKDTEKESDDPQKEMPGEKGMSNGKKDSGEERVQEKASKESEEAPKSRDSLDSKGSKDKSKESTPKLPSGPRDIDKDKVEDIEDLLTYYHIKQNNIHNTTEEVTEEKRDETDQVEIEIEPSQHVDPVFIEISVDKDTSATGGDKNDCLMVLESVQVEVDPSALMLQEQDYHETDPEMDTLEIEEDPPNEKEDPISLLTSSDEDDVIIQEPHIDTVEVSDETDEDDMPLVKLLRKRRAEKKKNATKKVPKKSDPTIAQITWGLYDYYCVQCHFKTSNAADYRKHMASHAKVILMCQLCGYMTASSSQFAKHEKQHGEKMYKCDLCDFRAKRNISLVYHMKTHQVSKEYKCGECEFVAYSDQAILRHIRFCNDGKKYKCDKCSYSTKKRSDLKRHKSRKHRASNEERDEDYVPPSGCLD